MQPPKSFERYRITKTWKLLDQGKEHITADLIPHLLRECTKKKDLEAGRHVNSFIVRLGLYGDAFFGDHLIRMFAVCGRLQEANHAFCNVLEPSIYTWNAIISAHTNVGWSTKALELFYELKKGTYKPDIVTFLCTLRACGELRVKDQGMLLHDLIIRDGFSSDLAVQNALLDMYCKCGVLEEAQRMFDMAKERSVVSWGALMAGYVQHGHGPHSLNLLKHMQNEDVEPNLFVFSSVLKACGWAGGLEQGQLIHDWIIETSLKSDLVTENTLIDMYAKCGGVEEARKLFDQLPKKDVVSWGALIAGYAAYGPTDLAFELFHEMQQKGLQPCKATFLSILKACVSEESLERGRIVHNLILRSNYQLDTMIGNTIVDMYAKCGSLDEAQAVFVKLSNHSVVSWGALIAGFTAHGHYGTAMQLFDHAQHRGIPVSNSILTCMLKVCGSDGDIRNGRLLHSLIVELGPQTGGIENMLLDMYVRCGSVEDVLKMMKWVNVSVVSWVSVMVCCCQQGHLDCAFKLFCMMQQQAVPPSSVIYCCLLKLCSSSVDIQGGRLIYEDVVQAELDSDVVIGNAVIDMFAKCRSIDDACKVFSALRNHDSVSWGALITGLVTHGNHAAALGAFGRLHSEGMKPTEAALMCSLKACGVLGAAHQGRLIHDYIVRNKGGQAGLALTSTLLGMYAKCGKLQEAHAVFNNLPHQDIVAWGAMVVGNISNSYSDLVRQSWRDVLVQGLKLDSVILTNILATWSQTGLVQGGYPSLRSVCEDFHAIKPRAEQYGCVIDLLGRSGCLNEAEDVAQTIPDVPDAVAWLSLLTSCRTYGNTVQGRRCYNEATQLDLVDAAGHMLMSSVYADAHMWCAVEHVQELRGRACVVKKAGKAWIEVNCAVHEFNAGERLTSQDTEVVNKLGRLYRLSKDAGLTMQLGLVWEQC